jgi:putative Mg2+ transporter-C (MgtC) family protein
MPLSLTWHEIAARLGLAIVAGALVGFDRGEHGRPAGLRTTLLVCLAAAVAMLLANSLLSTGGKTSASFATLDLMRLPLGILTGMGFIGAGAILRRDGLVVGVTTAATLWLVTVIGLCFGGGQLGLGIAATVLAVGVVSGLRRFDSHLDRERHATLNLVTRRDEPAYQVLLTALEASGYRAVVASVGYAGTGEQRELELRVSWRGSLSNPPAPSLLASLSKDPNVFSVRWTVLVR